MFEHRVTVRLQHTDAAGVAFFANVFIMAHECYEAFLDNACPLGRFLGDSEDVIMPIVHAEADFERPLRISDRVTIQMVATAIGRASFTLSYTLRTADDKVAARVSTAHATVSKETWKATALPEQILAHLKTIAASP